MTSASNLLSEMQPLLAASLERFGAGIAGEVAGTRALVDVRTTRIYSLAGTLSYVRVDDRETEIAVVSVDRRHDEVGGWAIDATGRTSRWLAEYIAPPGGDSAIDMGTAVSAVRDIEAIFQQWRDLIVDELTP